MVCNELITPDHSLKPLSNSDRAWCWGGLNYTDDDEPKVEELAVRFKTPEIAKEFWTIFHECLDQIVASAAAKTTTAGKFRHY